MFVSGLYFDNILAPCAKLVQPSVKNAVRVFAQGKEARSDLHNRLREVSMKRSIATTLALMALMAAPASADTLREALISTYQANPTITAQREALRATDSNVAIALAAGRPSLSATAGVNQDLTRTGGGNGRNMSAGVDFSYPLFNGGGVRNSVRAAETRVKSGRYTLRAVEGDTFVDTVTAYMDVIRDRAIVQLNQNNIDVLDTNLTATRDLFNVGDLTRTDIAQSEARLALARSQRVTSQGRLTASEENYRRVVGHGPGPLAQPPVLPPLPQAPEEAVQIALVSNPDLIAIVGQERAAGYDINVARATRVPTLSAIGSSRYTDYLGSATSQFGPFASNATAVTGVGVQARVPLYQGGLPAARIRQAQALQGQILEQAIGTERLVIARTRGAFATYQSALSAIASNEVAVSANTLALEGARAERSVGTRTVLDVLNAEQELLNAQVQLVSARHDAYVAGFQLLNAMGQAQADTLGLDGGPLYDPLGNYRRIAHNANDWAGDPDARPLATRTVLPEEQPRAVSAVERQNSGIGDAKVKLAAVNKSPANIVLAPEQPVFSAQMVQSPSLGAPKGWQLQLGAFKQRAAAESLLRRLSAGLLADKLPYLLLEDSMTRVQAGPYVSRAIAKATCVALSARGQACFVVPGGPKNL